MDEKPYLVDISQKSEVVDVISTSFMIDPLWKAIYPEEKDRIKPIRTFHDKIANYGFKYGLIYGIGKPLKGISIWLPPENHKISSFGMIKSGIISVIFSPVLKLFFKGAHIFSKSEKIHKKHVKEPHYYFFEFAVKPEFQGKGYGSKLIKYVFKKTDEEQQKIYLETMSEKNVAMYEHFGFKVVDTYVSEKLDLKLWGMVRDANGKDSN